MIAATKTDHDEFWYYDEFLNFANETIENFPYDKAYSLGRFISDNLLVRMKEVHNIHVEAGFRWKENEQTNRRGLIIRQC